MDEEDVNQEYEAEYLTAAAIIYKAKKEGGKGYYL